MSRDFPKLRYLEALPHAEGGKPMIILRDPLRIAEDSLVVSPEVYSVLRLFDGKNSLLDIQAELTRTTGRIVFREEVESVVQRLDETCFLDNQTFVERRAALQARFRSKKVRQASHSGSAYPKDASELTEMISSFYTSDGGAGLPAAQSDSSVLGLVVPHIDFRLGGPVYTHAYRALAESKKPDLFIIMGTGHMGLPQMFSLARKDFETPLGTARFDQDFAKGFDAALGEPLFEEDLSHRSEHTIEFQLVFLQHLYRGADLKILPVLTSFSYQEIGPDQEALRLFRRFTEKLSLAVSQSGRNVCYIASVDLAHIGPRYGDGFRPGQSTISEVCEKDRRMLKYVTGGDSEGFFRFIANEQDSRRICGFPALYTLLTLLPGKRGNLLVHDYGQMDPSGSFVTFASIVFPE
jgi:AmmeMemoRadiSam system protein B